MFDAFRMIMEMRSPFSFVVLLALARSDLLHCLGDRQGNAEVLLLPRGTGF